MTHLFALGRWFGPLALLGLLLASCSDNDDFLTGSDLRLGLSTDTLRFDTVFTARGSATRLLKLYNPYDGPLHISEIRLEAGAASRFRLNADGRPGPSVRDLRIAARDSLYVFADVTVDPDAPLSISPFVIYENLIISLNGQEQRVALEAFGQNANYIPGLNARATVSLLSCDFATETWDDPKPYVIFGVLVVDSCELHLPPGARVYVHGGLVNAGGGQFYNDGLIVIGPQGRLRVAGTAEDSVVIQGDRLEPGFQDVPGQWGGILLQGREQAHDIQFCTIKNSVVGIRVDSAATLHLRHSQILNTANSGLLGIHATVRADNCLIHSNGGNGVQFEYGGDYELNYCTVASYGNTARALRMSNVLCLDDFCNDFRIHALDALLRNSLFVGSSADEVSLFNREEGLDNFSYQFEHCALRVDELLEPEQHPELSGRCSDCLFAQSGDALFVDAGNGDFQLDTASIALGAAQPLPGIVLDLLGRPRDALAPDMGCYERQD